MCGPGTVGSGPVSHSSVTMLVKAHLSPALVLSLVLHVVVAGIVINAGARRGPLVDPTRGAAWQGETFDIDELMKEPANSKSGPASTPAPTTPATPAPTSEPEPKAKEPPPSETEARAPKPKPERPKKPEQPANAETPPASSARAGAATSESGSPRAGSTGEAPGVANLAKAFARALTAATHRDAIWDELPLGEVGSVKVVITLADDGTVEESILKERDEVPAALVRAVDKTFLLLKTGRFALSTSDAKQGAETFRIDFVLSQGTPDEDAEDPHHTLNMGFDPPLPEKAGRSYFDHASGRHFDAKITLLRR
jgi:hypothetical protein